MARTFIPAFGPDTIGKQHNFIRQESDTVFGLEEHVRRPAEAGEGRDKIQLRVPAEGLRRQVPKASREARDGAIQTLITLNV